MNQQQTQSVMNPFEQIKENKMKININLAKDNCGQYGMVSRNKNNINQTSSRNYDYSTIQRNSTKNPSMTPRLEYQEVINNFNQNEQNNLFKDS